MEFIIRNLQTLLMGAAALGTGVYALFGFERGEDEDAPRTFKVGHAKRTLVVGAAALAFSTVVGFVPAGHRGVIFDAVSGVIEEERGEGIALMLPFYQRLHNVDVRTQVFEYESFVQTKDLQEITLPLAINYHVDPDEAAQLYQEVGHNYETTIIAPAAFQGSTQATGQIVAQDIAVSRAELADSIKRIITPQLASHGITVEFVSVKDAVFDESFITQIKNNEIAKQRIVESERLVTVAENEASAAVRLAEGQAEAERVRGDGVADANAAIQRSLSPDIILWERVTSWDGVLPTTILGSETDPIVNLP